jgi:hypothetical protein
MLACWRYYGNWRPSECPVGGSLRPLRRRKTRQHVRSIGRSWSPAAALTWTKKSALSQNSNARFKGSVCRKASKRKFGLSRRDLYGYFCLAIDLNSSKQLLRYQMGAAGNNRALAAIFFSGVSYLCESAQIHRKVIAAINRG